MSQNSNFWDLEQTDAPGLSEDQIRKWEVDHGVQLPELLRTAYRDRNGGVVRATTIQLFRLEHVNSPEDDLWDDLADEEEEGFEEQSRVLIVGEDLEVGGNYLLNYNLCGDEGEPSFWNHFYDGTEPTQLSDSVTQYLRDASTVAESPAVDWEESTRFPILADESVDESAWMPPGTVSWYRLVQGAGCLIMFRKGLDYDSGGKRLTRTELPLPLDANSMALRVRRPGGPWMLQLQPEESDGIVSRESVQISSGGWKNRQYQGVPIYETIESESRERLEALRIQLIGTEAAQAARDEDQRMADLQRFSEGSPEQGHLAFMQMMQAMQGDLPDLVSPGEMPPELAGAAAQIAQMQQKMIEELNRQVAGTEVPPEIQAVIDSMKKRFGRDQS